MADTTGTNTLSHELIARDEQHVGFFFAGFAVQYYLHKDMLQNKLNTPEFLKIFTDMELYASQRVFVKNIIASKQHKKVTEEMQAIFLEYSSGASKKPQPYQLFLSRLNKAFLIRQIFHHNDQILEKYKFIESFLGKEVADVDLDELHEKMWHFPVEQQIMILSRIFAQLKDNLDSKKKTLGASFQENITRLKQDMQINPERYSSLQKSNIALIEKLFTYA